MAKRKPYKVNALFQPGPITFLNACVGQNGGPYEFDSYSLGYFEAAESIVEASRRGALTVDLVIYPIIYCYRHAIELALKYLIDKVPSIWNEKATFPTTHKLTDAWKLLIPFLQRDQIFDNGGNIALIDGVISDIVEFDPNAEVFRFPEDKGGHFYLQGSAHINIDVLAKAMVDVKEIFEYWFNLSNAMYQANHQS